MEKSSLDYREKLYSQIQEEYGKLVYTYTCHFKMADRLSKRNFWIKWGQIGLSAISTGGFLGVLISNEQILLSIPFFTHLQKIKICKRVVCMAKHQTLSGFT